MILRLEVEDKLKELNEILSDDMQIKQFHLFHDDKRYYLVDELNHIYDSGSLKSIHKTVLALLMFYCEISA